jgi:alpha-beta hydrolase superfamily lysophospholipase
VAVATPHQQNCESITLPGADGSSLFARWWRAEPAIGSVLYLHGIQSHGGWYEASAERIARSGFAVLMPDRRGSGRNTQDRGHTPSASRLLDDVIGHVDALAARVPDRPIHLLGVSWGGKLALAAYRRIPERIASLTLITPGLFPSVDLTIAQKVRVVLGRLFGRRVRHKIPLSDPALFTSNPLRRDFIASDPHRLTHASASLLLASRRLDLDVRRAARPGVACPIHLFLAGRDRIIDNRATRQFVYDLPAPERFITAFSDADHSLEFQADPEPYFEALIAWLTRAQAHTSVKNDADGASPALAATVRPVETEQLISSGGRE